MELPQISVPKGTKERYIEKQCKICLEILPVDKFRFDETKEGQRFYRNKCKNAKVSFIQKPLTIRKAGKGLIIRLSQLLFIN